MARNINKTDMIIEEYSFYKAYEIINQIWGKKVLLSRTFGEKIEEIKSSFERVKQEIDASQYAYEKRKAILKSTLPIDAIQHEISEQYVTEMQVNCLDIVSATDTDPHRKERDRERIAHRYSSSSSFEVKHFSELWDELKKEQIDIQSRLDQEKLALIDRVRRLSGISETILNIENFISTQKVYGEDGKINMALAYLEWGLNQLEDIYRFRFGEQDTELLVFIDNTLKALTSGTEESRSSAYLRLADINKALHNNAELNKIHSNIAKLGERSILSFFYTESTANKNIAAQQLLQTMSTIPVEIRTRIGKGVALLKYDEPRIATLEEIDQMILKEELCQCHNTIVQFQNELYYVDQTTDSILKLPIHEESPDIEKLMHCFASLSTGSITTAKKQQLQWVKSVTGLTDQELTHPATQSIQDILNPTNSQKEGISSKK